MPYLSVFRNTLNVYYQECDLMYAVRLEVQCMLSGMERMELRGQQALQTGPTAFKKLRMLAKDEDWVTLQIGNG